MKAITVTFRSFFRRGRNNLTKILSLGIGLAMGLVLIAKVYFEQSYDDFFPDVDRIQQIQSNYTMNDETADYGQTSGGVAAGMKDVIPEVEIATRFTWVSGNTKIVTADRHHYAAESVVIADSCLFDMFPRRMLAGDAKATLSQPMYALVSSRIAQAMGGANRAMGQTFYFDDRPSRTLTVGGVFEALPRNTHLEYDVVISLASIGQFMWDGSLNWMGNDRYRSYVKLIPNADPASLRAGIERVRGKYLDRKRLEKAGVGIDYSLIPVTDIHTNDREAKQMSWLLGILAFALLFTAVMNYLLIIISALVNRTREMAVHKCYGASTNNLYGRMFSEAFVDLLASLLLAGVLIYAFRGAILSLLGASPSDLFTEESLLILAGVCVAVFLVAGFVPGYLYSHIPVAAAFRRFSENRRRWKLALLFVQFIAAGFFVTLLVIIGRQYNYMISNDPGYSYDRLAYFNMSGVSEELRQKALDETAALPEVAATSTSTRLLFTGANGNNISLPGDDRSLFNIADLYSTGDGYFDLMEIPVIEGRTFTERVASSTEVMVSRQFVEKMKDFADWSDGAVGKSIHISEHSKSKESLFTICGVYDDVRLGVIGKVDTRASVMFYQSAPSTFLLVKLHRQTPEAMQKVSETLAALLPDKVVEVYSYPSEMVNRYADSRKFRDSTLAGGLVTLAILFVGLLGYTSDEMNRRRRETAIRKINGASVSEIERLFLTDISRMALPAVIAGCGTAYYVAVKWLERFTDKASLPLLLFTGCGIMVIAGVLTFVAVNCYRAASENPAINLKSE
jgi:putative ABC transport system permease protein